MFSQILTNQALINEQGQAVINVTRLRPQLEFIARLRRAKPKRQADKEDAMHALGLDDVLEAIDQLKRELINKGEATELFGQLRDEDLASSIATIEQSFGDGLFYPTSQAAQHISLASL